MEKGSVTSQILKNIKCHFKIKKHNIPYLLSFFLNKEENCLQKKICETCAFKKYHNFIVFKNRFTYTIYYCGTINITGIKNYESIVEAFDHFKRLFDLKNDYFHSSEAIIDNITGGGKFENRIKLQNIKVKNTDFVRFDYNNEIFPGGFLKFKKLGTIVLFHSGSYAIIGVKHPNDLELIIRKTLKIIY